MNVREIMIEAAREMGVKDDEILKSIAFADEGGSAFSYAPIPKEMEKEMKWFFKDMIRGGPSLKLLIQLQNDAAVERVNN